MGYRSYFSVLVTYPEEYNKFALDIGKSFPEMLGRIFINKVGYAFEIDTLSDNRINFQNSDEIKWYEFVEDLIDLSETFTGCLIECSVNGEEDDDFQEHVFKDGLHASSSVKMIFWSDPKEEEAKNRVIASSEKPRTKAFFDSFINSNEEE